MVMQLLACFAVLVALVVAGAIGLHSVLVPTTRYGSCPVYHVTCTQVPVSTIERFSGLRIPDTAAVVQSSARVKPTLGEMDYSIDAYITAPAGSETLRRVAPGHTDASGAPEIEPAKRIFRDYGGTSGTVHASSGVVTVTGYRNGERFTFVRISLPNGAGL